jgi:arginyl-tRNA synthetase
VEVYKEVIARCLMAPVDMSQADIIELLRTPPDPDLGDYAFPCFSLAKTWRKPPPQIAAALQSEVQIEAPIKAVSAVGPYLNFAHAIWSWQ